MLDKAEEKQVVKYSVADAEIEKMRSIYMDLIITDLNDKEQFDQVSTSRKKVKSVRCAITNEEKEKNIAAKDHIKRVKAEADRLRSLIEPIETHLQNEEQKVIDEQNRIKAEEESRQRAINQKRLDDLLAVECVMPYIEVATMTDEEFNNLYMGKTLEFEERQKAKAEAEAKEAERKKLEEIRLAEERVKQAEIEAKQKAEAERLAKIQADLDAQAKAIQDEKDRIAREEQVKKAAEEAKIKAEQEAKAKAEREAKEAEERQIAAENEEKRQEALKPDKEKLTAFAQYLQEGITYPDVKADEAHRILNHAANKIYSISEEILNLIGGL